MKLKKIALLVTVALSSTLAHADVRINGFSNLTAGVTSKETDLFGYSKDIDFTNNSLFAIQVAGDVDDNVTATAQILARGENGYEAEFEWAYLTYTLNDNSSFTAGRFRLPVFRYSASLDVGYSYHWISAPVSVYDVSFNNINGLRYDYSNYSGDFEYLAQISVGNYESEISGGINEGSDVILLSFEGNFHNFKGRIVWGQGDNVFKQPELDAALDGIAQVSPTLSEELAVDDDKGDFIGVGLEYDNFNWFISGEYTKTTLKDSLTPDDTAFYITAGTRIGKYTPHVTFQTRDGAGEIKFTDTVNALPEPFRTVIGNFNAGLQSSFFEDYSMVTVGVRYDLTTNVALKAELSKYDNKLDEQLLDAESTLDTNAAAFSVNYVF